MGGGGGGGLTEGVPIWLKKFLLGPIVKLNSICSFQVSSLLIHLGTCMYSSQNSLQISKIRGWFLLCFQEVKKNAVNAINQ